MAANASAVVKRWSFDRSQQIQCVGAALILVPFVASLFGWVAVTDTGYRLANAVGAATLTAMAWRERQIGFVVLEGLWSLVSVWSLVSGPA
jgi:hypothetical protein